MGKEVGERIHILRRRLKLSQQELAEKLGFGKRATTISDWERGKVYPRLSVLQKLIELFNVNPTWLLTGQGEMFLSEQQSKAEEEKQALQDSEESVRKFLAEHPQTIPLRPIPVINLQVPAGFPEMPLQEEQIIDYLYLPLNDIPRRAIAVQVKGESMSPTIRDGDIVVFEPVPVNIYSGDIVIVRNEWGELMLKRYREKDGEVFLTSDNPEYPTVKPNENFRVVGKVLEAVTRKRF